MAKRTSEAPPGASVPPEVVALVECFADNREAYKDVIHDDSIRIGGAGRDGARQPRLAATQ